ncbi:MAG: hypothetical protein H0X45_12550, partial [Planctomycetes bacterium]|nr:hypothetical protein [Planctomycetota bacterium]
MRDPATPGSSAFTLFEVAIALAIVSVGVVSVLLFLPAGIRAQQVSRFRLYASAKAMDLVESYNTSSNGNPSIDVEAFNPWDVPTNYRSTAPDLECRLASRRFGVAPLPLTIARRIDSDGGEIASILDDGGCIYFSQPQATTSWEESQLPKMPPNDVQKVVFAVVGNAQQDALFTFPWKAWPYTDAFPSPPIFQHHQDAFVDETGSALADLGATFGCYERAFRTYLWEQTSDPDIRCVFQYPWPSTPALDENFGYFPYAYPADPYSLPAPGTDGGNCPTNHTVAGATRYVQAALWYCAAKNLGSGFVDIATPLTGFVGAPAEDERWKQVQAMRFLAHAATCLTRWYDKATLDGGVVIPPVTWNAPSSGAPVTSPTVTWTHASITALHESCLALSALYSSADPYDWGAPRNVQRSIMMDYPLLQHDLFSPPLSGPVSGAP